MATPSPPITPAPPLAPIIQTDFTASDTLLTMGDLILRNPIQSTAIFFLIIFASTGLEYCFELLDHQRNAYHRNIILSTKEELAAVAFSQMILIFISLVVGFSETAKAVVLLATLMIVYMCVNFSLYVVIVNILQSRRALEWSYFEWGRLDMDSLHSKQEVLFKMAREVFMRRATVGPRVQAALAENKEAPTSIMPVLFASYLGHVERSYLKESFDFTWVTWLVLIGIVIVDAVRSAVVNNTGDGPDSVAITQILTFVFIIGWGLLGALVLVSYVQYKKLSGYISKWNFSSQFGNITSGNNAGGNNSRNHNNNANSSYLNEQDEAAERRVKTEEEMIENLSKNFYFGSPAGSLSVLQVLMLGLLWFTCVFCVGMVHLCWVHMGAYALFVYVAAAVPFFTAVLYLLPKALTDIFIAASISTDFDDDLITKSVNGVYDLRQVEEDDDSDNDGDDDNDNQDQYEANNIGDDENNSPSTNYRKFSAKKGGKGKHGGGRHGDSSHHHDGEGGGGDMMNPNGGGGQEKFDDEIDAPLEMVALGSGRTGAAPLRIQGVPPSSTATSSSITAGMRPGQFVWGPRRPIFTAPMGAGGGGDSGVFSSTSHHEYL